VTKEKKEEKKKTKKIISIYIEKIEGKSFSGISRNDYTHYIRNLCIEKILDII